MTSALVVLARVVDVVNAVEMREAE